MFEGFETRDIQTSETTIHLVTAGDGPPLLLLHGYPQSHVMWHKVAPALAKQFTVVVPDLRGYGDSGKPTTDPEHLTYSKRSMAKDMVEVMEALGHPRFSVAGHDRGGRVTYRMALDWQDRMVKVAVLDIMPLFNTWNEMGWRQAIGSYHWQLLAQAAPLPERLIGGDPIFYLHNCLGRWAGEGTVFTPEAMAEYERCFATPEVIHGSCEDYRAGASIDYAFDKEDHGKKRITAPLFALWGDPRGNRDGEHFLAVWREWADNVSGHAMKCGHFIPEELPEETITELTAFFGI
ncbi:alpha/beta hydrolase [bacterium SCGC AG-212-C10]|nr:alpha/beta hydrolase [bacterium SCGC AG-212-C10]